MDFKFDTHVPRDSPDMTPKTFSKGGVCKNSLGGDMHSHERLLVNKIQHLPTSNIFTLP